MAYTAGLRRPTGRAALARWGGGTAGDKVGSSDLPNEPMPSTRCPVAPSDTASRSARFTQFIAAPDFPCVGAKSALHKDRLRFAAYESFGEPDDVADLCARLQAFSEEFPTPGNLPVSFVAMFREPVRGEVAFETALWAHLQAMHDHDRQSHAWDAAVSRDPADHDFSMSIAGRAFFVVGLHPDASRLSRRAPFPCLVFNFHDQFESMKASGKYQSMQTAIRARDVALQGSVNPVLARFGEASEARQYSGRAVDAAWRCPFHGRDA